MNPHILDQLNSVGMISIQN